MTKGVQKNFSAWQKTVPTTPLTPAQARDYTGSSTRAFRSVLQPTRFLLTIANNLPIALIAADIPRKLPLYLPCPFDASKGIHLHQIPDAFSVALFVATSTIQSTQIVTDIFVESTALATQFRPTFRKQPSLKSLHGWLKQKPIEDITATVNNTAEAIATTATLFGPSAERDCSNMTELVDTEMPGTTFADWHGRLILSGALPKEVAGAVRDFPFALHWKLRDLAAFIGQTGLLCYGVDTAR